MIAAEDRPVQVACRVLGVSESGFDEQRSRPPFERAVRHAMLTDLLTQIHTECHGIYGARRVHAELTLGRGVAVGHNQVELLMRRAGLQGVAGRRKWKRINPDTIATDLVERDFARSGPNQLWVTDIVRHEALLHRVETSDVVKKSSGCRDRCAECCDLVVALSDLQAVVKLAEHAVEQVPCGRGVAVAGGSAPVVVGAGAG